MASIKQLILASESPFRKQLLQSTGLHFATARPPVDESAIGAPTPDLLATRRAQAKALATAALHPGALVIGADQVLSLHGESFDKAKSAAEARARLSRMAGQTHWLHSAYCLAMGDQVMASRLVPVAMAMRPLSDLELDFYVATGEWQGSVGCYQFENQGINLFTDVAAEHSLIIGLPLQALLADLRDLGINALTSPQGPWN